MQVFNFEDTFKVMIEQDSSVLFSLKVSFLFGLERREDMESLVFKFILGVILLFFILKVMKIVRHIYLRIIGILASLMLLARLWAMIQS